MSQRRSSAFQRATFLVLSTRPGRQEGELSRNLLCAAEDERESVWIASTVTTFWASLAHLGLEQLINCQTGCSGQVLLPSESTLHIFDEAT